ncbi:MAG: hypothetical protein FWH20_03795 [Oscillospiraceae bacterium]|nr:hypothetical protein [Oscillospiraceae bacterium]
MRRIKWVLLGMFISAGVWAAVIAPQAVESLLPEVLTVAPQKEVYREVVRGAGVIQGSHETGFFIVAAIREQDINAVSPRQPAELYGAAIGKGEFKAVVVKLAEEARRIEVGGIVETVVDVVLDIVNPNEFIRPGYTAEAVIEVDLPREILLIPYEAINQDDRGEYVLILRGNTAVRRDITTGKELPNGAEILSGVRAEDELILRPERIDENSLVRTMDN